MGVMTGFTPSGSATDFSDKNKIIVGQKYIYMHTLRKRMLWSS